MSRGYRDAELRTFSLDKIELLHKYAVRQDAEEHGVRLDVLRAAVASTVSDKGHKLYLGMRKALDAEASGQLAEAKVDPKKARKAIRSKLIATGAIPLDKR